MPALTLKSPKHFKFLPLLDMQKKVDIASLGVLEHFDATTDFTKLPQNYQDLLTLIDNAFEINASKFTDVEKNTYVSGAILYALSLLNDEYTAKQKTYLEETSGFNYLKTWIWTYETPDINKDVMHTHFKDILGHTEENKLDAESKKDALLAFRNLSLQMSLQALRDEAIQIGEDTQLSEVDWLEKTALLGVKKDKIMAENNKIAMNVARYIRDEAFLNSVSAQKDKLKAPTVEQRTPTINPAEEFANQLIEHRKNLKKAETVDKSKNVLAALYAKPKTPQRVLFTENASYVAPEKKQTRAPQKRRRHNTNSYTPYASANNYTMYGSSRRDESAPQKKYSSRRPSINSHADETRLKPSIISKAEEAKLKHRM